MSLPNDAPQRFVKHVVRRASLVARAAANTTTSAAHESKTTSIERGQTSSLQAPVVAMLLGGFVGVFLLFVLVGFTCKLANRPRSDNRQFHNAKAAMYQPSAAGYGSAAATNPGAGMYRGNESMHDVSNPKMGLLDSAQPMGRGGRYEEGDDSLGSANGMDNGLGQRGATNGGFGMIPSNSAGSFSGDESNRYGAPRRGHARGASTGIEVPGPAASATFRRNVSGAHPPIHTNLDDSYDSPHSANGFIPPSTVMPDGSGFTPGQIFDHNAINGGAPKASMDMRENGSNYLGGPPSVLPRRASLMQSNPQQRPIPRGPPPSSSKNRRSRYTQNQSSTDTAAMRRSRIDSVGPGTYRKSMFLPNEDSTPDFAGGSQMRRAPSNNNDGPKPLRRVESIGKGDPRRASRYGNGKMAPMMAPDSRDIPAPNTYRDGLPASNDAYLSTAGQNGWDHGRRSPYGGGSSNGSSSPLGPLGPNDVQQQGYMNGGGRGGGVRMMPYGGGLGAPMPRPGMATTQVSSPSSFAQAAPLGAGLGRGMEVGGGHAATRQIL